MIKGKLIMIIGPSWSWKSTLISLIKERHPEFVYPVSVTTRAPRDWEINWKSYYFLSKEEFIAKINSGYFLEHACVHWEFYYGLPKDEIIKPLNEWKIVIRELDVQWFVTLSWLLKREDYFSIFIKPPDAEKLINRIVSRANISQEELDHRLISLKHEMEFLDKCDFFVQNEDNCLEKSYTNLINIINQASQWK